MDYFFGFIILLGVLVFIHELGHFSVAKFFGMRVETFSIGMGKKIFSFKKGETEYALSLIPMGGYVKITGQDPREEVPPHLVSRSFTLKPLYQRAAVVLAGPLFNAILAVLVFFSLYSVGLSSRAATIDRVLPKSAAAVAGFQSGDLVVEVRSGNRVHKIFELTDLERLVGKSTGQPLEFSIIRKITNPDYTTQDQKVVIPYTPVLGLDRDSTLGTFEKRGTIAGIEKAAPAPSMVVEPNTWAATRRLPSPLYVTQVSFGDGTQLTDVPVESYFDLEAAWTRALASKTTKQIVLKGVKISLETAAEKTQSAQAPAEESFTLAWTDKDPAPQSLIEAGIRSSELVVLEVVKDSPAEKLGLKAQDLITHLNNEPVPSFAWFRETLQTLAASGEAVQVDWLRNGQKQVGRVEPRKVSEADPLTEVSTQKFQIGAAFLAQPAAPKMIVVKADNVFEAIMLGFDRSAYLTERMIMSFGKLATGQISPKTLGGPIMIAKISGDSLKQGTSAFMRMMAFISLNLFILNLLPIPVLDGGHLVMYCIEAIRRKPLPIKIIEVWTTAGFFVLMSLVAVVFFNDLSRLGLFKIFSS